MDYISKVADIFTAVKKQRPLVHHLTNFVTANDCANIVLALGASPVMAVDPGEVQDIAGAAAAVVINLGTLNSAIVDSMLKAGKEANRRAIPVVLDPVGVGATKLRKAVFNKIAETVQLSVVRGNMSEIKALLGFDEAGRGVDSTADESEGCILAQQLAKKLDCVIALTGKMDVIANKESYVQISNGTPMLAGITGTGCMATSLVACCCAVGNVFTGAAAGVAIMGVAGEIAQRSLRPGEGLGTFKIRIFDAVSTLKSEVLAESIKFI